MSVAPDIAALLAAERAGFERDYDSARDKLVDILGRRVRGTEAILVGVLISQMTKAALSLGGAIASAEALSLIDAGKIGPFGAYAA